MGKIILEPRLLKKCTLLGTLRKQLHQYVFHFKRICETKSYQRTISVLALI